MQYNGIQIGKRQPMPVLIQERERITKSQPDIQQWGPEKVAEYLAEKYPKLNKKQKRERVYTWNKREDESDVATAIKLAKEDYLALRLAGKRRTEIGKKICDEFHVSIPTFYKQLDEWGIKEIDAEERALELFNTKSIKADTPSPELVAELKKTVEEALPTKFEPEIQQPSPVVQKLVSLAESEITHKPSSEAAEPSKEPKPSPVSSIPETPFVSLPVTIDIAKLMFDALATQAYQTAVDKGWHQTDAHLPTQLALIHSEVSEALEADRKGFGQNQVAEELADIVIRVMDTAKSHRLDIAGALIDKMERNKHRSYRHGNLPY